MIIKDFILPAARIVVVDASVTPLPKQYPGREEVVFDEQVIISLYEDCKVTP